MSAPGKLFILYGSATGNAEHIAKALAAQRPNAVCCELNQFKRKCLKDWESGDARHGILIVASTTGNGDPPENASRFVRHIKKCNNDPLFQHCVFAVLGLGDTNYDQFCACGKLIDRKMGELGGTRLMPIACADEGTGLEDVVEPWTETILQKMELAMKGNTAIAEEVPANEDRKEAVNDNKQLLEDKENSTESQTTTASCQGVAIVKALLARDGHNDDLVSLVDKESLPRLACTTSKCEFVEPGTTDDGADDDASVSSTSSGVVYTAKHPFVSSIVGARYLTNTAVTASAEVIDMSLEQAYDVYSNMFSLNGPDGEKNGKRVIELSLLLPEESSMEFAPGDSLGLCAPNHPKAVAFVLELIQRHHGLAGDQLVSIDEGHPIPVRQVLERKVDLSGPVPKASKFIFHAMAELSNDMQEKACLQLLSSRTEIGERLCASLCDEQKWTALDFLQMFPSLQSMKLADLLSTFPPLPPRYYSVSSSSMDSVLKIAFAVVDYQTPSLMLNGTQYGERRIRGVATGWLEAAASSYLAGQPIESKALLPIFPMQSTDFRMPMDASAKLILIGPGTGIAPFVGFLRQKSDIQASTECSETKQAESGSIDVYFGCRYQDHDWIYRDEVRGFVESGIVTSVFNAFSREKGSSYRYVQHMMEENAERLLKLLFDEQASIFLCGDGNAMAKDVQSTLLSLFETRLGTKSDAQHYLDKMKSEKRFVLDIWS